MAARPLWRGHLRLALVSCPVALFSARHDRESIRFNMLNPKTGNRIKMVTHDAETGEELSRRDTVKGYEYAKGRYVVITDEDMESVRVESSGLMQVEKFVDAPSIDPIYYDASYYLAPDGKGSEDVYAVLREAITRTGKVALARVVVGGRERTMALRPMEGGLVAHTLNERRDLNAAEPYFERVRDVRLDSEMVALAEQLVQRQSGEYDPADIEDRYETRLRAMLDAKVQGEGAPAEEAPRYADTNVVDLMAALRKSLGEAPPAPTPESLSPARKGAAVKRGKAADPEQARRQPGLKLPIAGGGGRKAADVEPKPVQRARGSRRTA